MRHGCLVNGKHIRHKWTTDDRIILALLYKLYDNSDGHRLAMFNEINKGELAAEGFPSTGYPHNGMIKQKYDLERAGVGSDVWTNVKSMSASQARRNFMTHINSIEEAARDLQIRLRLRVGSPAEAFLQAKNSTSLKDTTGKVSASKPARPLAVAHPDDWEQSSSDDEDNYQDSPCPRPKKTFNTELIRSFAYDVNRTTHGPQAEDLTERTGRPIERPLLRLKDDNNLSFPALLFRACLPAHGFRARKFLLNINKVPPPPPFASETFGEMVDPHLRQYRGEHANYLSPFLSLAENPVRALKRIAESQLPLALAIFHTPEITADALARYGKLYMPIPYLVPTIVSTHDLERLPGGYNGRGEWLVWGSIECSPIAIFDKNMALKLFSTMARIKKIDEDSGQVVGRHLSLVADKYKELVAYKLLRAFHVPGFQKCPAGEGSPYDAFVEAAYDATRGNRAESIFSENMITPRKTVPVVEIPVYRKSQTWRGKEKAVPKIDWQVVEDHDTGAQISVPLPTIHTTHIRDTTPFSSIEEADDFQDLIDAQLRSDGAYCGIDAIRPSPTPSVSNVPPSLFVRELRQQALVPTPPPLSPVGYASSPLEPSDGIKTVIIDLCGDDDDDDDDNNNDEDPDADDDLRELPSFDLTSDHHPNDELEQEEDCSIIAAATRRGGGYTHNSLSIRSRSLSNAVDTPTRTSKRGRARAFKTR